MRIKDEDALAVPLKLEENKDPQVLAQEKCYFIRNLILNASSAAEAENRQRAGLYLLVNKLKESERKGRLSINMIERKYEQVAPVELRASKLQCE